VSLVTRFDQIEYACLTDVGVRRSHNQDDHAIQIAGDEIQWRERGHLFLVADGMGAHAVGEKASEQAARVIPHTYHKHADLGPASALHKAFVEANASIHACGQANREFQGMGTTSTALLLRPEGAWVGHVGDSRVYRVRGGVIEQLSCDHSLIWEYARLKKIDPEDVQDIPGNVIHRCLGPEPSVQIDVEGPHNVRVGDLFVLCSDGLSGQVSDPEIGALVSSLPPAEACRFLVDLANLRGGPDNITVLIVRINPTPNGANGAPPQEAPSPPARRGLRVPWWLLTLLGGTVLAICALWMQAEQVPAALIVFVLAMAAILAGVAGLGLHLLRERNGREPEDEEGSPPRVYRKFPCAINTTLLEKSVRALQALREEVNGRNWQINWNHSHEHEQTAEARSQAGDLSTAFREYCRAMLPMTQALHKNRQKEDSFQHIWEKSRL
jgi:serine/threonine protein phosphatase PrpC